MFVQLCVKDTVFYYHGSWAVSKLKLKSEIAEYIAVSLLTVLIDLPFDIVGTKYLHFVWHDTDPNVGKCFSFCLYF